MARHTANLLPMLALLAAMALPRHAAADIDLRADLSAAIALLGLPCGKVLEATPLGRKEHLVRCSDGHRYRLFVDADGRLVAEKR